MTGDQLLFLVGALILVFIWACRTRALGNWKPPNLSSGLSGLSSSLGLTSSKLMGFGLSTVTVGFVSLYLWYRFPETVGAYYMNGGPVWSLFLGLALINFLLAKGSYLLPVPVALVLTIAVLISLPVHSGMPKSACTGAKPDRPSVVGPGWNTFNPEGCDVTFAVTSGTVIFQKPDGTEDPVSASDKTTGRRAYTVYKKARAAGATAEFYKMLCPNGKAPEDGGWTCKT
jgi:hypothetical protein